MRIFDNTLHEQFASLLVDGDDQAFESKGMGSEKWHTMLRMVGRPLAGQGNTPGFLSKTDSFTVKTLTKETLGTISFAGWSGLHQDSQQNCYTITYLKKPWALTCDPCDAESRQDPFAAWCFLWCPCWTALCPFTLTASLLGCLVGIGRDVYNFSKNGLMQPLDDSKGIRLGLFSQKPTLGPERQVMDEEDTTPLISNSMGSSDYTGLING